MLLCHGLELTLSHEKMFETWCAFRLSPTLKAGLQMNTDDRIKESCFKIIADNRIRSQSRLLQTFRSAEVSKLHALCAGGKIAANNMADVGEEILPRPNLLLQLVLK